MREALLHGLWERHKLPFHGLRLTTGEPVQIWDSGSLNSNAGPDFLNARIRIGETLWAGHVELHLKSSHWQAHRHQNDPNYQNVVLHVVWEDDREILGFHGRPLPTLSLKNYISDAIITTELAYQGSSHNRLINCQHDHASVPLELKKGWWSQLYRERLSTKSLEIKTWLKVTRNDWEHVLFIALLKGFGLQVNAEAFLDLGLKLDFSLVQKLRHNSRHLESLLFGMAGLLDAVEPKDAYTKELMDTFRFLSRKFSLKKAGIPKPDFCRLRPSNFPTIRLSQLAVLISTQPRLFGKLMTTSDRKALHKLLSVAATTYWDSHYTLGKMSRGKPKKVTPAFLDLLVINTILPLQYQYARELGKDAWPEIKAVLSSCPPEQNHILVSLSEIGMQSSDGLESQALLQMYHKHCRKNRCLECAIGQYLLKGI